jgi:hypothetical protein
MLKKGLQVRSLANGKKRLRRTDDAHRLLLKLMPLE